MYITLHYKICFHSVLHHSDDGSCNCWNMSVFKLKSVVIFVKLIILLVYISTNTKFVTDRKL